MPKAQAAVLSPHPLHRILREVAEIRDETRTPREPESIPQQGLPTADPAGPTGEEAAARLPGSHVHAPRHGRSERQRFEDVAGRLRPDLYRYAFWLSRDPSIADDLVQEALMRGWKSLHSLKDEGAAKQWLLTIVRREHARMYERKRLETVDIDEVKSVDEALFTRPTDPDITNLRQAIFDLEPEYREPLVLQVLLGHDTAEIARLMDIRQGAVLTRLFRARKKLAAVLRASG